MGTSGFPEAQLFSNKLHAHHLVPGDLPSLRVCPSQNSVPSHLTVPAVTSPYNPIARPNFSLSPLGSRLASRPVRNGFVNLRTARSLRVNLHFFHKDAVAVCYRPDCACLKRTHTSLTKHAHRHTATGVSPVDIRRYGLAHVALLLSLRWIETKKNSELPAEMPLTKIGSVDIFPALFYRFFPNPIRIRTSRLAPRKNLSTPGAKRLLFKISNEIWAIECATEITQT